MKFWPDTTLWLNKEERTYPSQRVSNYGFWWEKLKVFLDKSTKFLDPLIGPVLPTAVGEAEYYSSGADNAFSQAKERQYDGLPDTKASQEQSASYSY